MAEHHGKRRSEHYEETTAPQNPPNSVLTPRVQRSAWWLYVFPLIVVCVVAGIVLLYWLTRNSAPDERVQPVGTGGEQRQEGGGDPAPRPGSTRDEVEERGGTERR